PMLTSCTLYCWHILAKVLSDLSQWFCGACGKMVLVVNTLPVASTTATLTPVRQPGARPIVTLAPAGAPGHRPSQFLATTSMASCSAFSRTKPNNSFSICNSVLIRHVHCTTDCSHLSAARLLKLSPKCSAIMVSQ